MTRKLPIGIQSFGGLRGDGYVYVDKTAYVYRLVHEGKPMGATSPVRCGSDRPAPPVELKWDGLVRAAADQVLDRDFPQVLRDLGVPILVVAVTYDAKIKEHACRIFEA